MNYRKIVKKVAALMIPCSLIIAPISTFATDIQNQDKDSTYNREYNICSQKVSVEFDPTIASKVTPNDIDDILQDKSTSSKVKIVADDNLKKDDLEHSTEMDLYVYSEGNLVKFQIEKEYADFLTSNEIRDMLADADCTAIHVYEVGEASSDNEADIAKAVPKRAVGYYVRTGAAKKTGGQYVKKDVFAGSVAKGETKKITYSGSLEFSVSSAAGTYYAKSDLKKGLKAKVSCSISRTLDSKGMKAGCNSREFRVKYYAQKYTRTQQKIDAKKGTPIGKKVTATVSEPTKYASYSKDTKK